jgi:PAS domain-containing protein
MLSYEPMLAWKLNGSIEFWNAGAERLYGFAPNEAAHFGDCERRFHAMVSAHFI